MTGSAFGYSVCVSTSLVKKKGLFTYLQIHELGFSIHLYGHVCKHNYNTTLASISGCKPRLTELKQLA